MKVAAKLSSKTTGACTTTTELENAKNAALKHLGYRPRTRKEIAEKLAGLGYTPRVVQRAIAALERLGLVDDLDFAVRWAQSRIRHNPKGPWLIATELRQKGVCEPDITQALEHAFEGTDLAELAAQALRRQYAGRKCSTTDQERIRKRMFDFLMRRGFDRSLALEVSGQVLSELVHKGNDPE